MADLISTYSESEYDAIYTSRESDTNAIIIDNIDSVYSKIRVRKTNNTDSSLAYSTGSNAAIRIINKGLLRLLDSYITTSGNYSPGVFSGDNEDNIEAYRNSIQTDNEYSPAMHILAGNADLHNNDFITNSSNSPALDIGNSTTTIQGGNIISYGKDSPAIQTSGIVNILNVDNIRSEMSDGIVILAEDAYANLQSSVLNISASGYYPEEYDSNDSYKFSAIRIGNTINSRISAKCTCNNSTINISRKEYTTAFKVINAIADINITQSKINTIYDSKLLTVINGICNFTTIDQTLVGNIKVDMNSKLNMDLTSTLFNGSISINGQEGEVEVTLKSSSWSLTANSYISRLYIDSNSHIILNGYTLWVSGFEYNPDEETEEEEVVYTTTYENTEDNQNAYSIENSTALLSTVKVDKSGDYLDEYYDKPADEYGSNAAVLADNSDLIISTKSNISSTGIGSPAVVSYNRSHISVTDSIIETSGYNSSALVCSHEATMNLYNPTVVTNGDKSHAIRLANLSGNISVNNGSFTTNGEESYVVSIDKNASGTIVFNGSSLASQNSRGINIETNDKEISLSLRDTNINTDDASIYILDNSGNHTEVNVNIKNSIIRNTSGNEATIVVDGAEVKLDLEDTNIYSTYRNNVISVINNGILYIRANQGYISGNIYVDETSKVYIELIESADLVGSINPTNVLADSYTKLTMRRSQFTLSLDSYITELDIDRYSDITIGNHILYVDGTASDFVVGSVVHYNSEDETISESNVVIISKSTIDDISYYTLYDTDDRITYNNVTKDNIIFTGKIIDIEPILQTIDELARNKTTEDIRDGDTVVSSTTDKNAIVVNAETKVYNDIHVIKSGDSKKNDSSSNSAVLVINAGDLTLNNSDIKTTATYANGIVSIGENSIVKVNNTDINTSSIESSAIVALDKGQVIGKQLTLNTTGVKSYGIRIEEDGYVNLESSTIQVFGLGSNGIIVKDSDLRLSEVTISHDRSIAPVDISGECNILIVGGQISDMSSDIATGGLYIHNIRTDEPVHPGGYDDDDNPSHIDPGSDEPVVPIPDTYILTAVRHITSSITISDSQIVSSVDPNRAKDEIVLWVSDSVIANLHNMTITRIDDLSTGGIFSRYYGVGAAILTTDGIINIDNSNIDSNALGGNAIFAYGANSIINISDSEIFTGNAESAALQVANNGTINSINNTINTYSTESNAIRVDRGGGTINVEGGQYITTGYNSEGIVSSNGKIKIKNTKISASSSALATIEGSNEIEFENCILLSAMPDDGENDCAWCIAVYRDTNDVEDTISKITLSGGSITPSNGGVFYVTNNKAEINLYDTNITITDQTPFLLRCTCNTSELEWGNLGDNGGICTLNLNNYQIATGNIIWDPLSEVTVNILDNSKLTTAIIQNETNMSNVLGTNGFCDVNIGPYGTLVINGNSRIRNLNNSSSEMIKDSNGRLVTIVTTNNSLIVDGNSPYIISVNSYSGISNQGYVEPEEKEPVDNKEWWLKDEDSTSDFGPDVLFDCGTIYSTSRDVTESTPGMVIVDFGYNN